MQIQICVHKYVHKFVYRHIYVFTYTYAFTSINTYTQTYVNVPCFTPSEVELGLRGLLKSTDSSQ
jgi:hypothetical protein